MFSKFQKGIRIMKNVEVIFRLFPLWFFYKTKCSNQTNVSFSLVFFLQFVFKEYKIIFSKGL